MPVWRAIYLAAEESVSNDGSTMHTIFWPHRLLFSFPYCLVSRLSHRVCFSSSSLLLTWSLILPITDTHTHMHSSYLLLVTAPSIVLFWFCFSCVPTHVHSCAVDMLQWFGRFRECDCIRHTLEWFVSIHEAAHTHIPTCSALMLTSGEESRPFVYVLGRSLIYEFVIDEFVCGLPRMCADSVGEIHGHVCMCARTEELFVSQATRFESIHSVSLEAGQRC